MQETGGVDVPDDVQIAPPVAPSSTVDTPGAAPPGKWRQFVNALHDGLRLSFLRRPRAGDLNAPWWLIGVFTLLSLVVPPLHGLVLTGLNGDLMTWSVPGAFFHLPLLALGVGIIAYLTRTATRMAELLLVALLVFFWIDVVVYLTWVPVNNYFPNRPPETDLLYQWLAPIWPALATGVYATRHTPASRWRLLPALLAAAIVWIAPLVMLEVDRQLWHAKRVDRELNLPTSTPVDEARLYNHAALLDTQLDKLAPQRPGVIDLYFVGVGGDASQDVFLREVNAVTKLMEERFDAKGRTVRLINSRSTLDSVPIASVTSVRESLQRVAERMDKDEDLLFLFLTSHGSETHRFQLQHWPVRFQELTPQVLRGLLDESGIRHRVLVVSACYSGGFVEALSNDDTLVLTAAAIDRTSFGCNNTAEWTYFGKAYFADALNQTRSFIGAFESAKPAIETRELAEKHKPSQPQMSIGANIRKRLDAFERQFVQP